MQTAKLETGAIVPLGSEEYCVNCGEVAPSLHMVENKLHCDDCRILAKANHIVHQGLDTIIENLVDLIPQSEWEQLGWRITVGYGGEPMPNGINWHCEEID